MKNRFLISLFLAGWLSFSLIANSEEPKHIVRDKSPDGKFGLEITQEEQGYTASLIDLKTKGEVVALEIYQNYYEEAHLVWSKDSQRVAYFEPNRRGGSTNIYFRNGDKFEEVELPELPECKIQRASGETVVKAIEETTRPQKWLSSNALVLKVHSDELMEKGDKQYSRTCTQIVTVAYDSNHKGSVQNAKRTKSD